MDNEAILSTAGQLTASRKGSPFAPGTAKPSVVIASDLKRSSPQPDSRSWASPESIGEGVWQETAASAAFASLMLIAFSVLAVYSFPAGGLAIGILGLTMAMIGLSSRRRRLSLICLVAHGLMLGLCYVAVL